MVLFLFFFYEVTCRHSSAHQLLGSQFVNCVMEILQFLKETSLHHLVNPPVTAFLQYTLFTPDLNNTDVLSVKPETSAQPGSRGPALVTQQVAVPLSCPGENLQ